ncbi:MAG: thioesterase family protein [Deltaproteobacteria bacterium]|nr:thioesterase family protein [Deltaproteobacteria bacterium]
MDLTQAMTPERTGETSFAWTIPDGWQQGKGAFGGLVMGAAIRAAEAVIAEPARALRAVTAELMAPALVGATDLEVAVLRTGSSVTVAAVALRQAGQVVAHAVATFGKTRDDGTWTALVPPPLPAWEAAAIAPVGAPVAPVFTGHFEFRPITGLPFSGGGNADHEVSGWVRPRAPGRERGAAYLAACVDAYWPVAMVSGTRPRAMATLTYTLQLVGALDPTDDRPLAYRARALAAGGGYVPEVRELWTADGALVAVNPQTFALSR